MFGEFTVNLTDKNRIVVPAQLRKSFDEADDGLIVSAFNQSYLEVYSYKAWDEFVRYLDGVSRMHADVQDYKRLLFSQVQENSLDSQGRLLLNEKLLQHITAKQLLTTITVIGMGDHIEIWNSAVWSQKRAALRRNQPATAERLAFLFDQIAKKG